MVFQAGLCRARVEAGGGVEDFGEEGVVTDGIGCIVAGMGACYTLIRQILNRGTEMAIDVQSQMLRLVTADGETISDFDALQGLWTEEQYLRLTDQTNRLLEFTDGSIEVLPMPTDKHQDILQFLQFALYAFLHPRGGKVQIAGLRLVLRGGKLREPDLMVLLDANDPRRQNAGWLGADLVMEIVSPDDPKRDTKTKRADYAEAGIPEYWIVNPIDETITVLRLEGEKYVEYGVFRRGNTAISALLEGFAVEVSAVLDAR
jgi:Uma2 family endonuclease